MTQGSSYGQILRSSSITAAASVVNVLIGLVRNKVAAVFLGPEGLGLIGLLQSLMVTASSVMTLGVATVGTRQIAEADSQHKADKLADTRIAIVWGCFLLGVAGGTAFWLVRREVAVFALNDASLSAEAGWLSIGVGLSVAAAAQSTLLNGLRRIRYLALLSVTTALVSCVLAITALLYGGQAQILFYVLATPVAAFLLGHWFVHKFAPGRRRTDRRPTRTSVVKFGAMVRLGVMFMLSGVVSSLSPLIARILIQQDLGPIHVGHFQASWTISMTYVSFVLVAMGSDYYPRLTALISDNDRANQAINEQTEVAILLGGPILLAMLSFAPELIRTLYTPEFQPAAQLLRWQILGDVLKLLSWPLGFAILASGQGRSFLAGELLALVIFGVACAVGLPVFGIEAAGVAFLLMYLGYLPFIYWRVQLRTGFRWTRPVLLSACFIGFSAVATSLISSRFPFVGAIAGGVLSVIALALGVLRLGAASHPSGKAAHICAHVRSIYLKKRGPL